MVYQTSENVKRDRRGDDGDGENRASPAKDFKNRVRNPWKTKGRENRKTGFDKGIATYPLRRGKSLLIGEVRWDGAKGNPALIAGARLLETVPTLLVDFDGG